MSKIDDLHPRLQDMVSTWSDQQGLSENRLVEMIDSRMDFDLTEVEDDDAEKFVGAYEDGDVDSAVEVLEDYDVPETEIEIFKEQIEAQKTAAEDEGEDVRGNGKSPSPSSGGGGQNLTEADVRRIAQEVAPNAQDIANELKSQMGGGGGGQSDGGQAQQNQMAQLISLAELFGGGGGGGQMAQLGEKTMNAAMQSWINDMKKPSLGDIMEQKLYQKVADEEVQEWYEDMYSGNPLDGVDELGEDEDDEDDDSGGWL